MKNILTIVLLLMATGVLSAQTFTLKSNDVGGQATQKQFANVFGCQGQNVSPQLSWENAPAGTQSFAVTVYDKDAPTGSGFWHWVIFNIPADVKELKSGAGDVTKDIAPKGAIQIKTDAGTPGYIGPCPPAGAPHEYLITVYALKSKLDLDQHATAAYVGFNLHFQVLEKASIVMYGKR